MLLKLTLLSHVTKISVLSYDSNENQAFERNYFWKSNYLRSGNTSLCLSTVGIQAEVRVEDETKDLLFSREVQVDACFPFGYSRKETQYDAIDDCSRFVFSRLYSEHCVRSSMEFALNLVRSSPFRIRTIRTDCGVEFRPGFTEFLKKLRIRHIRNAPYSPQHNGKVERYHRTLWQNLGEYSMKIDAQEYRLKLKMFENWYNYEKPHSGLGMFGMTPAEKIGYRLVSKTLRTARESEEPWGRNISLNVNLTLQLNKFYDLTLTAIILTSFTLEPG